MVKFLIIVGVLIIVGLFKFFKRKKDFRRDYTLGLKVAEEIQIYIKHKNYSTAEQKTQRQDLNNITQIIDHLSLSLSENELLSWNESSKSDLSKLALGTFYLHLAWITRSHKLAKNVSKNQAKGFFDYLQVSEDIYESISTDSPYNPEAESRKIRLYMSLGNMALATNYYNNLYNNLPEFIWPYIHYSELIQPKWGGTIENLEIFYESLPKDFLIHSIVELKLILDSTIMNDNYFRKYNSDIKEFARQKLIQIDEEYDKIQISSIHRYIFFNYMEALSDTLKLKSLKSKYKTLMDGNYTIYPYGLIK